jgi:hypothetical protein
MLGVDCVPPCPESSVGTVFGEFWDVKYLAFYHVGFLDEEYIKAVGGH